MALTIGTQTRFATLAEWTRLSLNFHYTVQAADIDEEGIGIAANALVVNGGTIKGADGATDADLRHEAVAAAHNSKVNGTLITPPRVTGVFFISFPARGEAYGLAETIEVEVEFDRAVATTGSPQLALAIGTETRHATLSAWGSDSLYFDYSVQDADRDGDGISIAADSLVFNGGTIKAIDGATDADLRHAAVAAGPGSRVDGSDGTRPVVRSISFRSSPARDDTYELAQLAHFLT